MFGIQRYAARPLTWIRLSRNSRSVREGVGLVVWRFRPGSTLIGVPLELRDSAFRVRPISEDGATLTLEGEISWRVVDPVTAAAHLDFSLDRHGDLSGNGLDRLEALAWRRELPLLARSAPRFVGPMD